MKARQILKRDKRPRPVQVCCFARFASYDVKVASGNGASCPWQQHHFNVKSWWPNFVTPYSTDNRSTFSSLQTSQNRWIKLDCLNFVCKEITFEWTELAVFLLTILAGFFRGTASLFFNDNQRTWSRRIQWWLRDGKALKVVLCTKFCPLCDKQVIAIALG